MSEKATTLRELYQLIEQDNPLLLDAPLTFLIHSGSNQMELEGVSLSHDLWSMPRANPQHLAPNEKPWLHISLYLDKHGFRKLNR